MIDLNLKNEVKEQDDPVGAIILAVMPFVLLGLFLLERGL